MDTKIIGRDIKITEALTQYVNKKLERLVKYFGEEFTSNVSFRKEGDNHVCELRLVTKNGDFKAETDHKDLYAAIDKNIDVLEGQIRKMKTKKDRQNMVDTIRVEEDFEDNLVENKVIKNSYYDIKPISVEDAKLELQSRPKDKFLVFVNSQGGRVNVIYRLKDGRNFGIVEPE